MKVICKEDFDALNDAGLIIHDGMDKNYIVLNRQKPSRRRKYAVIYDWRFKDLYDAIKSLESGKKIPERCKKRHTLQNQ